MASTLNWIVKDLESMVPSWNYASSVKTAPQIGDTAPASGLQLPAAQSTVILFTRHMGCPFCERAPAEIRTLVDLANQASYSDTRFIVVVHSVPTYELSKFVTEELQLQVPNNVTLHGDAERRVYAAWGLGELSLLEIINKDIISQVGELKKQGIANRLTRGTRWQTNGAFALDKQGKITYSHVGKNSGDTADLDKAVSSAHQ